MGRRACGARSRRWPRLPSPRRRHTPRGQPLNAYRVAPTRRQARGAGPGRLRHRRGRRTVNRKVEIYATAARRGPPPRRSRAKVVGKARAQRQGLRCRRPGGRRQRYQRLAPLRRRRQRRQGAVPGAVRPARGRADREEDLARADRHGRDIWRSRSPRTRRRRTDNTRPAVLYNAMQHAREWLAGETCRRTLDLLHRQLRPHRQRHRPRRRRDPGRAAEQVTPLVDCRELWFMCVPTRTATSTRSRPATACGARTWRQQRRRRHGRARRRRRPQPQPRHELGPRQRGLLRRRHVGDLPRPRPELRAETKAYRKLWNMVDFTYMKNDHTAAELLLYPQGFQQYTPTPDNGIFEALAGNDDDSAIADKVFNEDDRRVGHHRQPVRSGPLRRALHHQRRRARRRVPVEEDPRLHARGLRRRTSRTSRASSSRTSRRTSRLEFQRHRLFSIDLAESADDPGNPVSHMGNTVKDFYVDDFADSYGSPQPVQVDGEAVARRRLDPLPDQRRPGEDRAATREFRGGERYDQERGVYYHRLRGTSAGRSRVTRSRCGSPAGASPPRTSPTRRGWRRAPTCWSCPTRTTSAACRHRTPTARTT